MTPRFARVLGRIRRIGVRTGLVGGPSEFTRASYLAPHEVMLVTGRHGEDEALWPVDLHMPVGMEPPIYAMSCRREARGAQVVLAAREFVVNFMPATMEATVIEAGSLTCDAVEKRRRLGLDAVEAAFVRAPRLVAALGWLEVRVQDVHDYGDRTLVVGRVVHAQTTSSGPRLFHLWRP